MLQNGLEIYHTYENNFIGNDGNFFVKTMYDHDIIHKNYLWIFIMYNDSFYIRKMLMKQKKDFLLIQKKIIPNHQSK